MLPLAATVLNVHVSQMWTYRGCFLLFSWCSVCGGRCLQVSPVLTPPLVSPGPGSVDDMLDAENKRLAENLATKVSRLKSVSDSHQPPSSSTNRMFLISV